MSSRGRCGVGTIEPFGDNPPDEDPGKTGQRFEFNLRFPGQYFDKETGLSYNYYRDSIRKQGGTCRAIRLGWRAALIRTSMSGGTRWRTLILKGYRVGWFVQAPPGFRELFLEVVVLPARLEARTLMMHWAAPKAAPRHRLHHHLGCKFVREVHYGGPCKTCWYKCPGYGGPVTFPQAVGNPCPGISPDGLVNTSQIDPQCRPDSDCK